MKQKPDSAKIALIRLRKLSEPLTLSIALMLLSIASLAILPIKAEVISIFLSMDGGVFSYGDEIVAQVQIISSTLIGHNVTFIWQAPDASVLRQKSRFTDDRGMAYDKLSVPSTLPES